LIVVLFVSGWGFLFHVNSTILWVLLLSCRRASRVRQRLFLLCLAVHSYLYGGYQSRARLSEFAVLSQISGSVGASEVTEWVLFDSIDNPQQHSHSFGIARREII
jgi:hypothetical protein